MVFFRKREEEEEGPGGFSGQCLILSKVYAKGWSDEWEDGWMDGWMISIGISELYATNLSKVVSFVYCSDMEIGKELPFLVGNNFFLVGN